MSFRIRFGAILLLTVCVLPAAGQTRHDVPGCPVFARLPADLKSDAAAKERAWFELSQCVGQTVIVRAYERNQETPSLTVDTAYTYPALLSHTFNVLVLESFGGTTDHVLVILFHDGKPKVALRRSAGGPIEVKRAEQAVHVSVPPKTYPVDGKFPSVPNSNYSFAIEY